MLTWEEAVETLRKDPSAQELVRACYYDDPLIDAAKRFAASEEWQAVRGVLPSALGEALDIGAGRGIASFALAVDGWNVSALEPDPSLIVGAGAIRTLAQDSGLQIRVMEEWGESLPFGDSSFDLVYGRAVFHHANDLGQFCREVSRVLKPGGTFLITREHVVSNSTELEAFLKTHPLHHLYGGEAAYRKEDYMMALTEANLQLKTVFGPHSTPINFFPMSHREHVKLLGDRLGNRYGRIGRLIGRLLIRISAVRIRLETKLNDESTSPGRLYSFLGQKP